MKKLFIANRGEIACRIAGTANRMGIRTCGVFTPQDSHSKHVRMVEEVAGLPSGDLAENYLNQDLLIRTAKQFHADAIHPGYGFLSENPDFAQRVMDAGLIWVGPQPGSMRQLGDKIQAKEIARQAGVPVAPWMLMSSDTDVDQIVKQIGLPLLIKAAHGGGGRGQRIVTNEKDFTEAARAAASESLRSFGSAEVFVERFLDHPHHIEVQILGDQHGNIFTLGERDCTMQRRNQKLIEESPAAVLDAAARETLWKAAESLAAAVHYTNAGTIEFLAQKNAAGTWDLFFMELNARLQVEHPVTEMLWNLDLVELQLRIAKGENLAPVLGTHRPPENGHAIEVRLCAENPQNHFLPTPGPITEMLIPHADGLRIDSGFEEGDTIPQEYDSLFAKLIVRAPTREQAIWRATTLLDEVLIAGVITNKYFLSALLSHPDFGKNEHFTRWIDAHPELVQSETKDLDQDLMYWGKRLSSELFVQRRAGNGVLVPPATKLLTDFFPTKAHGGSSLQGLVRISGYFEVRQQEQVYAAGWINRFELCVSFQSPVEGIGQRRLAFSGQFEVDELRAHHGPIVAQVPGVVLAVRADVDQIVSPEQPILVVEAMKIEMPMSLPISARIKSIHVKTGDRIQPGQTLITWEPAPEN